MSSENLYEILSNYKFILSMENAVCDDYITEKLWRTYYVGSVPVIFGSEKINELLPTNKSSINIRDFEKAEDLAKYLKILNENDTEYEKYVSYKRKNGVENIYLKDLMAKRQWGINNDRVKGNFIDKFECMVCERLNENRRLKEKNLKLKVHQATKQHYGCPHPVTFDDEGRLITFEDVKNAIEINSNNNNLIENDFNGWRFSFYFAYANQHIFFEKYLNNKIFNFTPKMLRNDAFKFYNRFIFSKNKSKIDL